MSNRSETQAELSPEERDADSRVDMWCSVALVLLAWGIAMYWVSGQ
ncbi:MAG: hypothetical protein P8H97_06110 [Pseudomonadales bacterium]|nr:hypothetical protein [Pseudomonadales bacterium]MDG2080104.1 hypothetical protein [Pseudomonadales bacterium]